MYISNLQNFYLFLFAFDSSRDETTDDEEDNTTTTTTTTGYFSSDCSQILTSLKGSVEKILRYVDFSFFFPFVQLECSSNQLSTHSWNIVLFSSSPT